MWLVRKTLYECMTCLAVEWLVLKTLYETSFLLTRHSMNGVACLYDTLRTRDVSGNLAIVSHSFLSLECLAHKTLYERCGLFVRHSTDVSRV